MEVKAIVILAKSYKWKGWCIAGRELLQPPDGKFKVGLWIRPVTSDKESKGAIFGEDCKLADGNEAQVLDIVNIPTASPLPETGQPENYLIVKGQPWTKIKVSSHNLSKIIETPSDLWLENGMPTDRITSEYGEAQTITQSLYLIKPEDFKVVLAQDYNNYEQKYKKVIKASFIYNRVTYKGLSITDPKIRRMLKRKYPAEGDEPNIVRLRNLDDYYLCVSLGPRFGYNQEHYKFIATIFDFDGYIQRTY